MEITSNFRFLIFLKNPFSCQLTQYYIIFLRAFCVLSNFVLLLPVHLDHLKFK